MGREELRMFIEPNFLLSVVTAIVAIIAVIQTPLKESYHKELLIKLESLKEVATKIKFLFSNNEGVLLSDFVLRYEELLFEMYQYKIIIDKMYKLNEEHRLTIQELQERVGEEKYRDKLKKCFDNLKQADNLLKSINAEEKIKKQIKIC